MTLRTRIGWTLRCWADRVDPEHAPRIMATHTFTWERGRGMVVRTDGRGCQLAYLQGEDNYGRSWSESDTLAGVTA